MKSKAWIVLALATATLLSACSDDKKDEPGSPYAGYWLRQSAWAAYNDSAANLGAFCPMVMSSQQAHGIQRDSIRDVAWYISASGEVYHWTPNLRWDVPTHRSYSIGRLGGNGRFAIERPASGAYAYQNANRLSNPYSGVTLDRGLLVFDGWGGQFEPFVPVSLEQLKGYSIALRRCGSWTFAEYGYGQQFPPGRGYTGDQGFADGPSPYGPNGAQPFNQMQMPPQGQFNDQMQLPQMQMPQGPQFGPRGQLPQQMQPQMPGNLPGNLPPPEFPPDQR
ncbi:MAG: hypothetical protein KF799_06350 [Bdellovibrionales bacterium]|nr:hypothetical protein [Bdellovibrionales bacterium]